MKKKYFLLVSLLILGILVSACSAADSNSSGSSIQASGTIASDSVNVAPELGGKVLSINVQEGDSVNAGDVLFKLDDSLLQAQYTQTQSGVDAAQATLDLAQTQLEAAQVQYQMAVQGARMQDVQQRSQSWTQQQLPQIDLPAWYFQKSEQITAMQAAVQSATDELAKQQSNLDKALKDASNQDFIAVENQLAEAQAAFQVAYTTNQQSQSALNNASLKTAAQKLYDSAKTDLDSAQLQYDRMLTSDAAKNVLDARAQVAVAQSSLDHALDNLTALQSGEDALQVQAASIQADQAQKTVGQAQANLSQAQAALHLIDLQIQKMTVSAPMSGVILLSNLKIGELTSPGATVITIGKLSQVDLTVYIPEAQYGQVKLDQQVSISVDSFPGKSYSGIVTHISDQAEYTPRNVQTVEGRKTTVYAVKISINNDQQDLKPGMPADVNFIQ
jgi:HlyD family secretion protein